MLRPAANVRFPPIADIELASQTNAVTIQFDIESRRSVDDATGDYLEHHFHHYQDPLRHYTLHSKDGELLLSASVAERRTDTRGDGTVGLIEADVFRVSVPQDNNT